MCTYVSQRFVKIFIQKLYTPTATKNQNVVCFMSTPDVSRSANANDSQTPTRTCTHAHAHLSQPNQTIFNLLMPSLTSLLHSLFYEH